jgi:hypothetical protein
MFKPDQRRAPRRAAAAERQRRQHAQAQRAYRRRERTGAVMVTVEVSPAMTDKLVRLRYLRVAELENRGRIATAIAALIDGIIAD